MGPPESASAGGPSFICRLPHENPLVSPPAMVIISVLIQSPVALSAFENPVSARSGMRGQLLPVEGLRQCGRKVCGTHQRQCRSDLTRVMRAQLELMACVRRPATSNNRRSMSVAKLAAAMPTKTARRLVLFPEVPSRLRRPTCSARLPSSRWGGRCARSRLRTLPAHVMEDCGLGEEVIGNRF